MGKVLWWLTLCVLGILAAPCRGISPCLDGITINVILLDDEVSPWSLKFVKGEVLKAIETDKTISTTEGNKIRSTTQKCVVVNYGLTIIPYCCTFYSKKLQNTFVDYIMI